MSNSGFFVLVVKAFDSDSDRYALPKCPVAEVAHLWHEFRNDDEPHCE